MKRLLDIEFHKFRYSRSSKVLTTIYLTIVVLLMFGGMIRLEFNGFSGSLSDLGIFNFPIVWHISTYFTSFLKIFIAIVIVSLTASEYSNRTIKQNLIDGLSKKELVLSKFYFVLVLAVLTTIIVFVASLILGLIYSDYNEIGIIFSDMQFLGAFFLSHLIFFCFCLFAGILLKRSAFALGFVFVWYIFEALLNLGARGLDYYFQLNSLEWLQHILPLNAMSNLIKQPFTRISLIDSGLNQLGQGEVTFEYAVEWIDVASVIVWSTLFIYWSYWLIKRRDL
ncbi:MULTISPECIES: ABC transporter permease [Nonlabens]|uniref:ABC transporter permease n=1 Tax=Nonlabens agnitus TaxID=870484 RepID=A0A2S9WTN2_9FLAO|nr:MULTISPECIES: ABC transporter permease subunit [Nonlabens]KQC33907.1 excinuclease ABC subunit B [Nonlabens sp. YIK11]PRP66810.1 ABC transporter permease [Nonlabens agnitus]